MARREKMNSVRYLQLICLIALSSLLVAKSKEKMKLATEEAKEPSQSLTTCGIDKINVAPAHRLEKASAMVGDVAESAEKKMSDVASDGADEAKATAGSAYETAKKELNKVKEELGEAYETTKHTMSENAKVKYEAAKEKVSQAMGDIGGKMHNEEL